MDYKLQIAQSLHEHVSESLSLEDILGLLEKPKSVEHGDVAFPTFSLAKVFRKAPQQIAADLGEKNQLSNR